MNAVEYSRSDSARQSYFRAGRQLSPHLPPPSHPLTIEVAIAIVSGVEPYAYERWIACDAILC
jgi:hypothetical protein